MEWHPLELQIIGQWRDWLRGIPPGRKWRGRGAQNPLLLQAFDLLTSVENAYRNEIDNRS